MSEKPDVVYGRLLESAHLTGYSLNRVFDEFEWLLDDGRWKQVGDGYDDINVFLRSISLPKGIDSDQRKALARKLTRELEATQRATAQALGVGKTTILEDVSGRKRPQDSSKTPSEGASEPNERSDATTAAFRLPGEDAARAVKKAAGRSARDKAKADERKAAQEAAREEIAAIGEEEAYQIEVGDIHSWRPADVSCIVTDPPYITDDAVELHSALADFALDVLPEHGALVVMTWQPILPAVFEAMRRDDLVYRWTVAWRFGTKERTPERGPRVYDGWKPVLVFHKGGWTDETTYLYDVVVSEDADKDHHAWGQSVDGFRQLVRAAAKPGDLVCDPFVGGGTTAVAAKEEHCKFTGIDISAEAVQKTKERLKKERLAT